MRFHSIGVENKLKVLYRKYSQPERSGVSLLPPAKSLLGAASRRGQEFGVLGGCDEEMDHWPVMISFRVASLLECVCLVLI